MLETTRLDTITAAGQIPSMMATLCSYENCFGPYHPQTLGLMVALGVAYARHGETAPARWLLERAIANLARESDIRTRAIEILRDLFLDQGEVSKAGAMQRELMECQAARLGPHHPVAITAQEELAAILLSAPGACAGQT